MVQEVFILKEVYVLDQLDIQQIQQEQYIGLVVNMLAHAQEVKYHSHLVLLNGNVKDVEQMTS